MNTTYHHLSPDPHPRRRGFTLVELLTVIAVIGILAAILVPTIGSIRTNAERTASASNLRQWAQALLLFANENSGRIPFEGDKDQPSWGRTTRPEDENAWFNALPPYVGEQPPGPLHHRGARGHDPQVLHPLQSRGRAEPGSE